MMTIWFIEILVIRWVLFLPTHSTINLCISFLMSSTTSKSTSHKNDSANSISETEDMKLFQAARRTGRRNACGDMGDQFSQGKKFVLLFSSRNHLVCCSDRIQNSSRCWENGSTFSNNVHKTLISFSRNQYFFVHRISCFTFQWSSRLFVFHVFLLESLFFCLWKYYLKHCRLSAFFSIQFYLTNE